MHFGAICIGKQINMDKVCRILTKFPNVEYLELHGVYTDGIIDTDKLKKSYPNLKGLLLNGGRIDLNNRFVNTFGNDLYFLHHPNGNTNLQNVNFNKLQQLILERTDMNTIIYYYCFIQTKWR